MGEENYLLNIDILGFGKFVQDQNLDNVINFYSKIITGSVFSGEIHAPGDIEVMVYSDTIAIKSNNENKRTCLTQLIQIAKLLQSVQYSPNGMILPIRGTITHGNFVFHKGNVSTRAPGREQIEAENVHLIFGKPIVESYYFEKDMEIIGIALADSVTNQLSDTLKDWYISQDLLVEYNIPLKKEKYKKNGILVNPVSSAFIDSDIGKLTSLKDQFDDDSSEYKKYQNTINFYQFLRE